MLVTFLWNEAESWPHAVDFLLAWLKKYWNHWKIGVSHPKSQTFGTGHHPQQCPRKGSVVSLEVDSVTEQRLMMVHSIQNFCTIHHLAQERHGAWKIEVDIKLSGMHGLVVEMMHWNQLSRCGMGWFWLLPCFFPLHNQRLVSWWIQRSKGAARRFAFQGAPWWVQSAEVIHIRVGKVEPIFV